MSNLCGYLDIADEYEVVARRRSADLNDELYLDEIVGELNDDYFDSSLPPISIKFVTNMRGCYGRCFANPMMTKKVIKINHRLTLFEDWILEVLVMHEMTHLIQYNHSRAFWQIANRHPDAGFGHQILHAGKSQAGLSNQAYGSSKYDFTKHPEYNLANYYKG